MKLSDIALALQGRLVGADDAGIVRVVHPADARGPQDLALAMDKRLLPLLGASPARFAVVAAGAEPPPGSVDAWIEVGRSRYAMAELTALFDRPVRTEAGIHPSAVVHPTARLGEAVAVGPFSVIGAEAEIGDGCVIMSQVTVGAGARLGKGCLLHPGVRVGDRVEVGDRAIFHHNLSLGADGFSFVTPEPGSVETAKATGQVGATNQVLRRINSIGTVVIGDDVEIGANTAIDRGTISATRIGSHSKIDNLVQIGHNVRIGEGCMICGQVGIAGSAVVGDRVVLAGQVGIADHVTIGNDAVVGAKSAVGTDVAPRTVVMGIPAMPRQRAYDQLLNLGRLKGLFAEVATLKERLKSVEKLVQKD